MDEGDLFREWRAADREAHAMELLVRQATLASLGGGKEPTAAEREKASALREKANALFVIATQEMKKRADAAKR